MREALKFKEFFRLLSNQGICYNRMNRGVDDLFLFYFYFYFLFLVVKMEIRFNCTYEACNLQWDVVQHVEDQQ